MKTKTIEQQEEYNKLTEDSQNWYNYFEEHDSMMNHETIIESLIDLSSLKIWR